MSPISSDQMTNQGIALPPLTSLTTVSLTKSYSLSTVSTENQGHHDQPKGNETFNSNTILTVPKFSTFLLWLPRKIFSIPLKSQMETMIFKTLIYDL